MANSITLFVENAPELLDKVYQATATTADFDIDGALVKAGANANEIVVPKLDMDGLGDYDRNSGYIDGDIALTNETVQFNYERGRKLKTDMIDNEETGGVILANVTSEFLRTKVVPEVDAVRYAEYASTTNISSKQETLTASTVYAAIAAAYDKMTNDEVPEEDRHLRITPTLLGFVRDMDNTKSKELLNKFASIKTVPQSRFVTAVELNDGKTSGEEKGGFKKASGAADINFMIIHKPAVLQCTKHAQMKLFTPAQDQDGDNYKWLYRIYGLNSIYENKVAGIYCSHK